MQNEVHIAILHVGGNASQTKACWPTKQCTAFNLKGLTFMLLNRTSERMFVCLVEYVCILGGNGLPMSFLSFVGVKGGM